MPYSIAWLILIANLIDRVATGYGQSLAVVWDESSVSMAESSAPFKDIENQMKIEKLCATISGTLSIVDQVPNIENDDPHSLPIDRLIQDLSRLEMEFADQDCQRKSLWPLSIFTNQVQMRYFSISTVLDFTCVYKSYTNCLHLRTILNLSCLYMMHVTL